MKELIYLSEEEISELKGGVMSATSTHVDNYMMGDTNCCNVEEKPDQNGSK